MSQNPTNKVTKKAPIDGIELLNMPYGAPDLKAVLQKYTLRGLITAILIFALGTGGMATYFYLDAKGQLIFILMQKLKKTLRMKL